jgi:hypothetical protein
MQKTNTQCAPEGRRSGLPQQTEAPAQLVDAIRRRQWQEHISNELAQQLRKASGRSMNHAPNALTANIKRYV